MLWVEEFEEPFVTLLLDLRNDSDTTGGVPYGRRASATTDLLDPDGVKLSSVADLDYLALDETVIETIHSE